MTSNSVKLDKSLILDESSIDQVHLEVPVNPFNYIDVVNTAEDFFALREQWNEINESSLNGNVFVSWEWLYTWWETYQKQDKRSLYILKCTNSDNELLGIAPFQIISNYKKYFPNNRQLLLLGTGETDGSLVFGEYMDLIIRQGHETAVISVFSDYLYQYRTLWDGLKFQQQLSNSHLTKLFDTTSFATNNKFNVQSNKVIKTITNDGFKTYIDLPSSYKDYLMSLRKKMRNNITRTYSRLESEKSFTIETVTAESDINAEIDGLDTGIETLAKLNRARRDNMQKDSVFATPNFELFHRRLVKRLLPLNKVSLRVLRFDDEPVAALYSFVDRGTVHAYQSGFETENGHRYSLLTTMLTQEISNSIENPDISRFNFMYSDNEDTYKKRYSGDTEEMFNISYDNTGVKYSIYRFIHGIIKPRLKKILKIS